VKGYSQLPIDNFLVKAYTEVNLEGGQTYEFEARGDDEGSPVDVVIFISKPLLLSGV
jgi:hypothetical protein